MPYNNHLTASYAQQTTNLVAPAKQQAAPALAKHTELERWPLNPPRRQCLLVLILFGTRPPPTTVAAPVTSGAAAVVAAAASGARSGLQAGFEPRGNFSGPAASEECGRGAHGEGLCGTVLSVEKGVWRLVKARRGCAAGVSRNGASARVRRNVQGGRWGSCLCWRELRGAISGGKYFTQRRKGPKGLSSS